MKLPKEQLLDTIKVKKVLRPYQGRLADACLADIEAGKPEVLLAACPGAGKTEIALSILSRYLKPGMTALVLAHGTVVLKAQFEKRLATDFPELVGRVRIAIPHERKSITGHYDLLVVDEAHEFYEVEKGMMDEIRKKTTPCSTLLLTGSPSVFIGRKKNPLLPHAYSLEDMNRDGEGKWNSDLMIELATSKYLVKETDYTGTGEVKESVKYTQKQTDGTLESVLERLMQRLYQEPKKLPWMESLEVELDGAKPTWSQLAVAMDKTILACPRVVVANQVARFFEKKGVKYLVSHSENDPDNLNIDRFKAGEANVLVVVGRGLLGFDMDTLVNFVDMSGSKNPNRIFQMLCRVVRTPQDGSKPMNKLFLKVMPEIYSDVKMRLYVSGVLMLAQTEFFSTWNGKNFMHLEVAVRTPSGKKKKPGQKHTDGPPPIPVLQSGMMVFGDYFKGLAHTHDKSLESHAWCRLADVFGVGVKDPEGNFKEACEWAKANGRWPKQHSQNHEENRLAQIGNTFIALNSRSFRVDFLEKAKACGYTSKEEKKSSVQTSIVRFGEQAQRRPSSASENTEERRLGVALLKYTRKKDRSYDEHFTNTISLLPWFLDSSKLEKERLRRTVFAASKGGEFLSADVPVHNKHSLWRCAVGHEWSATTNNVFNGRWCPTCGADKSRIARIKLSPDKESAIVQASRHGQSQRALASKYGVSQCAVRGALKRANEREQSTEKKAKK